MVPPRVGLLSRRGTRSWRSFSTKRNNSGSRHRTEATKRINNRRRGNCDLHCDTAALNNNSRSNAEGFSHLTFKSRKVGKPETERACDETNATFRDCGYAPTEDQAIDKYCATSHHLSGQSRKFLDSSMSGRCASRRRIP